MERFSLHTEFRAPISTLSRCAHQIVLVHATLPLQSSLAAVSLRDGPLRPHVECNVARSRCALSARDTPTRRMPRCAMTWHAQPLTSAPLRPSLRAECAWILARARSRCWLSRPQKLVPSTFMQSRRMPSRTRRRFKRWPSLGSRSASLCCMATRRTWRCPRAWTCCSTRSSARSRVRREWWRRSPTRR